MDRRKDCKDRADYPASYEEYKGSVQEENEERVFLEFSRKHGIESNNDHILVAQGVMVIACIAAIVSTIVWLALF